jgi:PAS domain S-box-containing protein
MRRPQASDWVRALATYVVYTAAAIIGLQWALASGAASPVWPAAGIAIAAVTLWGRLMAVPVALGLVTASQLTGADHSLWSQMLMGIGNAAAALLGGAILRLLGPPAVCRFAALQSVTALFAAAILSAALSAVVGTTALFLAGGLGNASAFLVFRGWLFGDVVGILFLASLILSWSPEARAQAKRSLDLRWLLVITAIVALSSYLVFFGSSVARAWAIYPALVWAALTLRARGASLSLFLAATITIVGTELQFGPFARSAQGGPDLLLLQQFLAVTGATVLLLAAMVDERDSEAELREVRERELSAKDELARVEAILSLVTESAPIAIFAKDREGRYLYANAPVFEATRTDRATLIGATDEHWAPPDIAKALRDNDEEAMSAGAPVDIEEVLEGPDSHKRVFRGLKAPLRDTEGQIIGMVGVSIDITERKAAELELANRTAELESLLTSAPLGFAFFSRDHRWLRINETLAEINGIPADQVIGRRIADLLPALEPDVGPCIDRVFATGQPLASVEVSGETPRRPGVEQHWLTGYYPVRGQSGEVEAVGSWVIEITERKLAEERERLLAREVDHRAKNLLAVVQSIVQLSRGDDVATFRASIVGRIQSLARAHSLLSASRWEGVSLGDLAAEELAPYTLDRQDRVTVNGPALQLRPAAAQSLALALHELATNAVKYGALGKPDGRLDLGWERADDGGLTLTWRESGAGPLAEPTRSGFGSRVVAASIERQLGGKVERQWKSDGMLVRIDLPAGELADSRGEQPETAPPAATPLSQAPPAEPTRAAITSPAHGHARRLMIVEDEALIGLEAEHILADRGFEILGVANSVADALQLAGRCAPHAALLDLNLAGEDSFPVAEALTAKGVRIVFCTGYDTDRLIPPHLADARVLRKPFDADELEAALS